MSFFGGYTEINPPASFVFSLFAPAVFPGESTVVVSITPNEGGSTVPVTNTGAPSEIMEGKWKKMLGQLKMSLEVW